MGLCPEAGEREGEWWEVGVMRIDVHARHESFLEDRLL